MDPIEIIKEDHHRIENLFEEYEAYGEDAYDERQAVANALFDELTNHTEMEETIAYPAFRAGFDENGDQKVEEGYAEHDVAKNLIEELKGLDPQDAQFDAKMKVLKESVMHHIEEEEGGLLPLAEDSISGEDMARIGEEMRGYKDVVEEGSAEAVTAEDWLV